MFDARVQISEMRHRMANDLALLATALAQQRRSSVSTQNESIDDAVGSVLSLAAQYRRLYDLGERADFVNLPDYLGSLGRGLRSAYLDRLRVKLDCDIAQVAVPPAVASDIGCILVEVISNAARHAFGPEGGRIIVTVSDTDEALICTVVDDGCGLGGQDTEIKFSGLQLAAKRAARLGGRLDIRTHPAGPGFAVALTIPDRTRGRRSQTRPH
jgi:two-component sensor histidine kinase